MRHLILMSLSFLVTVPAMADTWCTGIDLKTAKPMWEFKDGGTSVEIFSGDLASAPVQHVAGAVVRFRDGGADVIQELHCPQSIPGTQSEVSFRDQTISVKASLFSNYDPGAFIETKSFKYSSKTKRFEPVGGERYNTHDREVAALKAYTGSDLKQLSEMAASVNRGFNVHSPRAYAAAMRSAEEVALAKGLPLAIAMTRQGKAQEAATYVKRFLISSAAEYLCKESENGVTKGDCPKDIRCYGDTCFTWQGAGILNDAAFVLEQGGDPGLAIQLLEWILERHPERTVAYLNLSDAFATVDDPAAAKVAAERYVELMTKAGKAKSIPTRVQQRL